MKQQHLLGNNIPQKKNISGENAETKNIGNFNSVIQARLDLTCTYTYTETSTRKDNTHSIGYPGMFEGLNCKQ